MEELPKGNTRLTEVFRNGDARSIRDLKGEYYVDILTGLPSIRKLNHRKKITIKHRDHSGFNTVFKKKKVFG